MPEQEFNPFGLTGTRTLAERRRAQRAAAANVRRQRLTGQDFLAAETGNALGLAFRDILGRAGIMSDPDAERAARVDAAIKRTKSATAAIPPELRDTDTFGAALQQREVLIQELDAAGMTEEADTVRQQMIGLRQSEAKLNKLNAEGRQAITKADVGERTAEAQVATARAGAIEANATAKISVVDAAYAEPRADVNFRQDLEDLAKTKELRPLEASIKQSEAQIAQVEATVGGPLPGIVKLQAERQNVVNFLTDHPNDPWAQKRLKEINAAINTEVQGIVRNVDNYQPTTAMLTTVQQEISQLSTAQDSVGELIDELRLPGESLGALAQKRSQIANVVSSFMPLIGFDQTTTSSFAEFIASKETQLRPQSLARKLKVELLPIVKDSGRTSPTDVELLEDMIQATEAATSDRAATVALLDTLAMLGAIQERNYTVLEQGISGLIPPDRGGTATPPPPPGSVEDLVGSVTADEARAIITGQQ